MGVFTGFRNLRLQNFRCFEDAEFQFGEGFNVIIGENGKGKSTILDAFSLAIASYLKMLQIPANSDIRHEDVRKSVKRFDGAPSTIESSYPARITGILSYAGSDKQFSLDRGDASTATRVAQLVSFGISVAKSLESNPNQILPLFAYYGTARAYKAANNPLNHAIASRTVGYSGCLAQNIGITAFSGWLEKLTYISLQEGTSSGLLESVLDSIYQCLPEVHKIEFRVRDNAVEIFFKDGMIHRFNDLSDGYRSVLTLAADIAYRAACLNPHLTKDAMRHITGVVLIDEIDIHLHPRWQRRIVGDLKRAFPGIQFITTTHSPFIIQSLEPDEILNLNHLDQAPQEYEKLSIEDIAEEIMGIPVPQRSKRHQDMYDAAKEYYSLLENAAPGDSAELKELEHKLQALSAPFSEDVAYTAFLESKLAETKAMRRQKDADATR